MDVAFLRNEWSEVRIGYAIATSELRGCESIDFDLLICLQHDWPACPCKVIELQEVWRHPQDRKQTDPPPIPAPIS